MSPRMKLAGAAGALLVHRHLPLGLHVVEHDHLLAADDRHLPHLVRVEPRQVHVGDLPAREAQEAEDDVLDALVIEALPCAVASSRILVDEVEDHREVVHAERPEGVLVRADDAEVDPVAVDAEHVADLARVDQLLQLQHGRVVEQEMAGHEHEVALLGDAHELVHLGGVHRRRLLDEDVLAGLERLLREREVRRHRRRDHDRVERVVGEQVVVALGRPRVRVARRESVARCAGSRSQTQVSSARPSKFRTRFGPQ